MYFFFLLFLHQLTVRLGSFPIRTEIRRHIYNIMSRSPIVVRRAYDRVFSEHLSVINSLCFEQRFRNTKVAVIVLLSRRPEWVCRRFTSSHILVVNVLESYVRWHARASTCSWNDVLNGSRTKNLNTPHDLVPTDERKIPNNKIIVIIVRRSLFGWCEESRSPRLTPK